MAPHSHAESSYYRSAILSNSKFFLGPEAEVDVVEERDVLSRVWHMHVVKTEAGERTKVLTRTAPNPQDALRLLHEMSGQAVNQYASTNGYGLPPTISDSSKPRTNRNNHRGGEPNAMSTSEVIAICGSSSEEEDEEEEEEEEEASDSNGSRKGRTNKRGRRQRRNRRVAGEAVSKAYSCSDNDDDNDEDDDDTDVAEVLEEPTPRLRHVAPPPWYPPGPGPSQPMPQGRRPPGWNAFPGGPPVSPPGPPGRRPQPPGPGLLPRPMNMNMNMIPPRNATSMHPVPVLLSISWTGRGCKNMLGQVAPSGDALRTMALKEVCMRPTGFIPTAPGMPLPPFTQPDFVNLRAVIRRMTLGADVYEVASFGDDLSPLFRTSAGIPKFDIEVCKVMMPAPRRRANSVSSTNSDDDINAK